MERRYWVTFVVIALVGGMVIGFGVSFKASRVAELERQVERLTKENADLKAQLAAPITSATPVPGSTPVAPGTPAKQ